MTGEPSAADVGALYDQLTDLFTAVLGGSIHVGYWESDEDESTTEAASARLTELVADRLDLAPGLRVLDVGCGSGRPAAQIAAGRGVHVTGVTVSAHQLRLAQDRPERGEAPGQASFQLADAMDLPFATASFDGAYAIESMTHIRDKDAALGHIARVLRPGARLVIADLYLDGPVSGPDADALAQTYALFQVATLLTADGYREHLRRAGLEIVEFTDIRRNARRTYAALGAGLRRAAARYGDAGDRLVAGASTLERLSDVDPLGYVLLSAVRADR
ncbi:SAM-dependent methyltransferase [Actinomadura litoris]|uniref:SAM-dependent methyltransferase n=1 Tax=Actinomadura litoris TaxID=2678616 RepID=UPI001FA6C61D|nr:methyltransferase domain-containing protein [Actinomadura litoris]